MRNQPSSSLRTLGRPTWPARKTDGGTTAGQNCGMVSITLRVVLKMSWCTCIKEVEMLHGVQRALLSTSKQAKGFIFLLK